MKYLLRTVCHDAKGFVRFRFPEIDSLATMAGVPSPCYDPADAKDEDNAFVMIETPTEEQALQILNRSILSKGLYECWGSAATIEELQEAVKAYCNTGAAAPYLTADRSFSVRVEAFGRKLTQQEQEDFRLKFSFIPWAGPVQCKNPDDLFYVFIDCGTDPANVEHAPKKVYFCREITRSIRKDVSKYTLKKRKYLGPTSTAAELAFLMANQALCRPGTVIFDPFVGTGSLIVACAHFGSLTIGSDIDWKVLHGKTRAAKSNIFGNFKQYNLPRPELLCSDQSNPSWRFMGDDDADDEER